MRIATLLSSPLSLRSTLYPTYTSSSLSSSSSSPSSFSSAGVIVVLLATTVGLIVALYRKGVICEPQRPTEGDPMTESTTLWQFKVSTSSLSCVRLHPVHATRQGIRCQFRNEPIFCFSNILRDFSIKNFTGYANFRMETHYAMRIKIF